MDFISIAKRYSKALMIEAKEQNSLEKIGDELRSFVCIYEDNNSFVFKLMNNPSFHLDEIKKFIIYLEKNKYISKLLSNFFILLITRFRFNILPFIKDEYIKDMDHESGKIRAKIISTKKISNNILDKLILSLELITEKKIIPELLYDENILAGIKVEIGGMIIDGTLNNRLENLQKKIISTSI